MICFASAAKMTTPRFLETSPKIISAQINTKRHNIKSKTIKEITQTSTPAPIFNTPTTPKTPPTDATLSPTIQENLQGAK